ncbi:glycosyltransferase family 4 protein [Clostridium pasteurianum]|uniref:Glycosyltransferase n=1 Tax=Clostridium pasteurianum BC1 TaxID=86416 RepID=R4K8M2_CLOPA|nr:glycosyltransferase family 4 protein [Clostridium pasteurianum]AGK98031.1 glycosyltransferase [Clostridium pasteurianum BC1]
MRIVMLSWEYPPKNIGGLSNHVHNLSRALTLLGHEIHVITCEEGTSPVEENDDGIIVHRVTPYKIDTEDFTKWIMQLNFSMIEECIRIIRKIGKIDIIHAHDWLSAYSAKALKWSFNIPMVSTIHATEEGRNNGIRTDMQRYISSTEWLLTYESWKIISCSNYMKEQIISNFKVADDKIWVVPNGVDSKGFDFEFNPLEFRRNYALDDEKIIFFIGRHVFEKGIQLLIDAAPRIIAEYSKAKFVIAGTGPMTEELKYKVKQIGLENKILFSGYMNNEIKSKLYRVANIAVFPSLYEPFGIVALEAMAAGCPIVVSDTGGLSELVKHRVNGMKMINGLVESLKDNVLALLQDNELCERIKEKAKESVKEKYTWEEVAKLTTKMYTLVKSEALDTEWDVDKKVFTETNLSDTKKSKRVVSSRKTEIAKKKIQSSEETKPRRRSRKVTAANAATVSKIEDTSSEAKSKTRAASNAAKTKETLKITTRTKTASKNANESKPDGEASEAIKAASEIESAVSKVEDSAKTKIRKTRTRKPTAKSASTEKISVNSSDGEIESTKKPVKRTRRTKKTEE